MFPIRDENPTVRTSIATFVLIAANVAVWVLVQGLGSEPALAKSVCRFGAIPGELLGTVMAGTRIPVGPGLACVLDGNPNWITVVTSMFMHGGWFHLIGNMWFLLVFGDNVEDVMGRVRFVIFYLICGVAAVAAMLWRTCSTSLVREMSTVAGAPGRARSAAPIVSASVASAQVSVPVGVTRARLPPR